MKEFFINAIDTIKDDRFGWRFKICNIIYNDYLRQYLASAAIKVEDSSEYLEEYNKYCNERKVGSFIIHRLNKAHDELFEIFDF